MSDLKQQLITLYDGLSSSNSAMNKRRVEAIKLFKENGFPTVKLEEWKFTNINHIIKKEYEVEPKSRSISKETLNSYLIEGLDSYKVIFINGHFQEGLSDLGEEVEILPLSQLQDNKVFDKYYGTVIKHEDSLDALNSALATEGVFIHVGHHKVVSKPVEVVYISDGKQPIFTQPRNLYVLGKSAELKVIESHYSTSKQAHFTNAVSEYVLWEKAHLDFYKTQNDYESSALVDHVFAEQRDDSVVSINTVSFGGDFVRNNLNFKQVGEHCNSIMQAVTIGKGTQLIDHHTLVEHTAPNCESHELYRTILDDKSKGVFNGKIIVDDVAQKIDAFQQNNNILLTDTATVNTKPQLEIFADDVKCSHGCTVGQLDKDAMFYMQSRGIPFKEAKAFLLYAFSVDVLESVGIQELKLFWSKLLAKKLGVDITFD